MRVKRLLLTLMIAVTIFTFSGCVNVTYSILLKDNEKADVNISVLYNNAEFNYDNEKIKEVKDQFESSGYDVKNIKQNGLKGFELEKKNIKMKNPQIVTYGDYKVDILNDILDNISYEKNPLVNKYIINSEIDLSSYAQKMDLTDKDGKLYSSDDYNKLLSELNLKLILKTDKGNILSSNSIIKNDDIKSSEWVLIPGSKNKIEFSCTSTDTKAVIATIIIFAAVTLISVTLLIIFIKMYLKKNKK